MKFHSIALTKPIHPNAVPRHLSPFSHVLSLPFFSRPMSLPRTNPILLIFLSRACKGSYSSSSSDCTPIAVCCCYETIDLSLFLLFFPPTPLSTLYPGFNPLCDACWRYAFVVIASWFFASPLFRKMVASLNGISFFFFFSHSTLSDPLDRRRFIARTREIRLGRV